MLICLDAGHAGPKTDPGAVSLYGIRECDLNLSIAKITAFTLQKAGLQVIMTRNMVEEAITNDLAYRCQIANKANCQIFISIHCNSFFNTQANGWEIFHHPESLQGFKLAYKIAEQFQIKLPLKKRGLKKEYFYVLKHTKMPAVLIESGFLSNLNDAHFLTNAQNHYLYAQAITNAVLSLKGGEF